MRLHSLYTQDILYIYLHLSCLRLLHLLVLRLGLWHLRAPSSSFVHLCRTLLLFTHLLISSSFFISLRVPSSFFLSLCPTFVSSFVPASLIPSLWVFVSPRVPFGSTSYLRQSIVSSVATNFPTHFSIADRPYRPSHIPDMSTIMTQDSSRQIQDLHRTNTFFERLPASCTHSPRFILIVLDILLRTKLYFPH